MVPLAFVVAGCDVPGPESLVASDLIGKVDDLVPGTGEGATSNWMCAAIAREVPKA